uniref:Uncharacterized protein n=1 Tax=Hymenopteran phasma-related virus OKIAV244 TaxID=2746316 RepID=A0A7D7EY90_9VIRU|nr:hypothetical protein [Hymenopteran phasma-related virus OKIAV244]
MIISLEISHSELTAAVHGDNFEIPQGSSKRRSIKSLPRTNKVSYIELEDSTLYLIFTDITVRKCIISSDTISSFWTRFNTILGDKFPDYILLEIQNFHNDKFDRNKIVCNEYAKSDN